MTSFKVDLNAEQRSLKQKVSEKSKQKKKNKLTELKFFHDSARKKTADSV